MWYTPLCGRESASISVTLPFFTPLLASLSARRAIQSKQLLVEMNGDATLSFGWTWFSRSVQSMSSHFGGGRGSRLLRMKRPATNPVSLLMP